jgi:tetratricopeptide (TPR) repeat protein
MGVINSKLQPRVSPSRASDDPASSMLYEGVSAMPKTLQSPISSKFVVVWLDADITLSDVVYQNSISRLQRVFISLHTFTNVKDCIKFLTSVKTEMILLVVTNEFFEQVWSRVKSMSQIHSIYILSADGEKVALSDQEYNKVKGVFSRVEPICSSLKRGTRHFKQDSLVMSIIPSTKFTKKDLPQLNQLFIYWMLVKQIILETKYDSEVIRDLTKFCRTQYFANSVELKIIEEFERSYHQHSPIWWFTRESFVCVMLSRALQTQDIEIIIRMGFFIKDLHQQIEKLQFETLKTTKLPIVTYRSQNISNEDFERLKNIQGSLLAFNNFIMADSNYDASLELARRAKNNDTGIGILFHLKVDSKQTSSPFTSLQNVSYSPEKEKCILFSMHSVFRIIDIVEIENRLWEIHLVLTEPNDEHITSLTELLRTETQDTTGWYKLAQLTSIIRDYDHARDIYFALLELVPDTDVLKMAHIYNELGVLDDEIGDYASALQFYQKSIEIRRQFLPPNHRSLSVSYNNMGEVQRQMGDYFNALSTHKKTLDMKQKGLHPSDLSFAKTYNNIGLASELLGEYATALEFYQKAIEVKRRALPPDHQELATTYNNIGELQREMGNFQAALTNLEKALSIRLKKYSPTDPILAITYNNIGLMHRELGDFAKAVMYLEKSLDVKLKHFPANHSSLAFTYNNIGDIRQQMGEFTQALSSYQTALDIQEKSLTLNHPETSTTYVNIGVAHQSMGNYTAALEFFDKALTIRKKAFPANHPALATNYNNIGHVHQLMGEYTVADEYYQKTLKIQQKTLQANHPSIAATYNNIADIQRKLGNHKKALTLYKKSLDIKKKSLPVNHPSLVITYNNMGVMHQSLKNYTAALECYKQTLEIQQKTLPPSHPDLAAIYNNMGVSHQSMKEYSIALDYFQKAIKIQEKALPTNHPDIATTHNSIATVLINLGDFQGALKEEQQAVEIASQSLAADHPHLLTFRNYHERIRIKVESMKKK